MSKLKDIFYVYYPIYILAKCTGFVGYSIEGPPNRRRLELSKKYATATNVLHITVMSALIWCYFNVFTKYRMPYVFFHLFLLVGVLTKIAHYFIHVIAKHLWRENMIRIFHDLDLLHTEICRFAIKLRYTHLRMLILVIISSFVIVDSCIGFYILYNSLEDEAMPSGQLLWEFCRVYINISQSVFVLNFISVMVIINDIFGNFNTLIAEIFLRNYVCLDLQVTMRNIMQNYYILMSVIRKFNRINSLPLSIIIAYYFIKTAPQVLGFVQHLVNIGFSWEVLSYFLTTSLTFAIKLGVLVGVSNECQRRVRSVF